MFVRNVDGVAGGAGKYRIVPLARTRQEHRVISMVIYFSGERAIDSFVKIIPPDPVAQTFPNDPCGKDHGGAGEDAARLGESNRTIAREALEKLCRAYWYPLYAFVRSRGYSAADAQDLTQAFFARIIEKGGFVSADRKLGRFRSYLLGAMKHFLANEWQRVRTQKRGGRVQIIEWEALDPEGRYAGTSKQPDNPELLFDREWALQIISGALQTLREEMTKAGKGEQFDVLKGALTGQDELSREQVAARLSMSEGTVKVAVHRLRRRYRELLRAAVAETVSNEDDLNDEMQYLVEILRRQ